MASGNSAPPAWNNRACAKCGERSLSTGAKSLVTKDGVPVCHHKFCLTCRDKVEARKQGWVSNGEGCPECEKPFAKLVDAALPSGEAKEFFRHVNISGGGKISQAELSAWITSFFDVSAAEAADVVEQRWPAWDTETRGWVSRKLLRRDAKDGTLDPDEFAEAQRFLADIEQETRRGRKRPLDDPAAEPAPKVPRPEPAPGSSLRAQGLLDRMQTTGLLSKLKEGDGSLWFTYFDRDSSGKLSKDEVVDAMVETLRECRMTPEDARSIVDGVWDIVDHDRSQEIEVGSEFARLREMLLESTKDR